MGVRGEMKGFSTKEEIETRLNSSGTQDEWEPEKRLPLFNNYLPQIRSMFGVMFC